MYLTLWLAVFLTQTPATQAALQPIQGRVLDPEGKARAGVEVFLTSFDGRDPERPPVRTVTDGEGRFQLSLRSDAAGRPLPWQSLLAWEPGFAPGITTVVVDQGLLPGEITLKLVEKRDVHLAVREPDGRPAADVRVQVVYVVRGRGYRLLPEALRETLARVTDDAGRITFDFSCADDSGIGLMAESVAYGQQTLRASMVKDEPLIMDLRPVGSVVGRVNGLDPAMFRRVKVVVSTSPPRAEVDPWCVVVGSATAVVDQAGRFEIKAIAQGQASLSVDDAALSPFQFPRRYDRTVLVKAGEKAEATLEFLKGRRLCGRVIEKGTCKPIAGITLSVGGMNGPPAVTNVDGRYLAFGMPGRLWGSIQRCPGYVKPVTLFADPEVMVQDAPDEQTLPDIELTRGAAIRGSVVDREGKGVAGARVTARWTVDYASRSTKQTVRATTDAAGRFVVADVVPEEPIEVEAETADARSGKPVTTTSAADEVTVRISADFAAHIRGRVVDASGKPVSVATLRVISITRSPEGHLQGMGIVEGIDYQPAPIILGANGTFVTPMLDIGGEYRIYISGTGLTNGASDWIKLGRGETALPDIVVGRFATVRGRVTDRGGKPIAGAIVRGVGGMHNGSVTHTRAEGQFLIDVPPGRTLVFAEKKGYAFTGCVIDETRAKADLVMVADGEAPERPMKRLDPPWTVKQANEFARRLCERQFSATLDADAKEMSLHALASLAEFDPKAAQAQGAKSEMTIGIGQPMRASLAIGLARSGSWDEAMALVEASDDARGRQTAYLRMLGVVSKDDKDHRLALATAAVVNARAIDTPADRIIAVARWADELERLGRRDDAGKLRDQLRAPFNQLSQEAAIGAVRGRLDMAMSRTEPDAVIKDVAGFGTEQARREYGVGVAQRLAATRPEQAEALLRQVFDERYYDNSAARVAYEMAAADPDRARRVVDLAAKKEDKAVHAYALGAAAMGLATRDPALARRWLDEAFAELRNKTESYDRFDNLNSACSVAAAMLPFVEKIAPERLSHYFWLCASWQLFDNENSWSAGGTAFGNAQIAAMLARYDRDVARVVRDNATSRLPALAKEEVSHGDPTVFYIAALLIAPDQLETLLAAAPPRGTKSGIRDRSNIEAGLIQAIRVRPDDPWAAMYKQMGLWNPGPPGWND